MARANLLVVDDDPKLRSSLRQGLEESGYGCVAVASVAEALEALEDPGEQGKPRFDLVLLDVMLEGPQGWSLLESLRERGDRTPVVFLTARHSVEERIRGLELGADDYVIKPFVLRELLARVQAVLRRGRERELRFEDVHVDLERRRVQRGDELVELSPREFELLTVLMRAGGRTCSRSELLHEVWGVDFDPGTNVVEVTVARLRRKLERGRRPLVRTDPGAGYGLGTGTPA